MGQPGDHQLYPERLSRSPPGISRRCDEARRDHAAGVVGSDSHLKVDEVTAYRYRPSSNEREAVEDDIVAFFAFGTPIAQITPDHQIVKPRLVVELEDK